METLSASSGLVQELQTRWQTWFWSIQGLPQYVLHQLVSLFFYISQIYNLGCLPPQNGQPNKDRGSLNGEMSPLNEGVQRQPQASPATSRMRKPNKMPVWDKRCHVKGCISRWVDGDSFMYWKNSFPMLNIGLIKADSWTNCSGSSKAGDQPIHGHCKSQPGNFFQGTGVCSTGGPSCGYPDLPLPLSFPSIAAQLFQQLTFLDRIFSPLVIF